LCRVPFFLPSNSTSTRVRYSWRPRLVILMSDGETETDVKCPACHGAGTVAGAQPVRSGPFLLNPPLCRVCGGTGREPRLKHPE
jgi:hypothetical protein